MLTKSSNVVIFILVGLVVSACTQTNITASPLNTDNSRSCVPLLQGLVPTNGSVVVQQAYTTGNTRIISMETMESRVFRSGLNVQVSPTGSALMNLDFNNNTWTLDILRAKGSIELPLLGNVAYVEWVNDQVVAIKNDYQPDTRTLLLNWVTGEATRISTAFPDLSPHARELLNIWKGIPKFDPSSGYAIYPTFEGINLIRASDRYVIANIDISPASYSPEWRPTGGSFIISLLNGRELVEVDVYGHSKSLIELGKQYPNGQLSSYQWSPNSKKVAFWFAADSSSPNSTDLFGIVELSSGKTWIACAISKDQAIQAFGSPVWSPDSRYLAISASIDKSQPTQIYIIDTKEYRYSIIPDSMGLYPLGWLIFDAVK